MNDVVVVKVRHMEDVHVARHDILRFASGLPFNAQDRGRIAIAIMELGTNLVKYGGGGTLTASLLIERPGLKIVCEDSGPGIAEIAQALRPGYSTSDSLGDGLASIKGVMDSFVIDSEVGCGLRVEVEKWLR